MDKVRGMHPLKKYEKLLLTPRDQIKANSAQVGKAAYDIISKPQAQQTVEETIEAMTAKYYQKLMEAVEEGAKAPNYPPIFYVIIERKKETLMGNVSNILKHKYITSPFKPRSQLLREECPNSDFDVYEIDKPKNEITLIYTLPTAQDSRSILKNPQIHDPQLVRWIEDYNKGILDQTSARKQRNAT